MTLNDLSTNIKVLLIFVAISTCDAHFKSKLR